MHDESGLLADTYFITIFCLVLKREFFGFGNCTCWNVDTGTQQWDTITQVIYKS